VQTLNKPPYTSIALNKGTSMLRSFILEVQLCWESRKGACSVIERGEGSSVMKTCGSTLSITTEEGLAG